MQVSTLSASKMSDDMVARWGSLQRSNPDLASPFFRPEFTQIVGAARSDASVAIVNDGEAFFPFHNERIGMGIGRPIGGNLSDYHGIVAAPGFECDIVKLVRAAGLAGWEFDHAPLSQSTLGRWMTKSAGSPRIDLAGWANAGSNKLRNDAQNRRRKLARELGTVELEFDCRDPQAFQQCMAWKAEQYERTGMKDIMKTAWVANVLEAIRDQNTDAFSGVLSILRAGGRPIAAHFGMRSFKTFHYWFPTYDPRLSIYSPGTLLLLEIGDAAAERGLDSIDLGKGDAFYKQRIANAETPLIEGIVVANALAVRLRDSRRAIGRMLRQTPVRQHLESLVDTLRNR
jgi:CelD/BcsL family acetyltransferase involved in cellulose biosynthesis